MLWPVQLSPNSYVSQIHLSTCYCESWECQWTRKLDTQTWSQLDGTLLPKTFIIMQTGIIIENTFPFKIYNPDDRNLVFCLFVFCLFLQYCPWNPCSIHPNQANDYNSLRLLEVSWLSSSNKDRLDGRWFRELWEGVKAVEVADDGIQVDAPYERLIGRPLQVFQQKLTHAWVLKFQTQKNLGSKLDFMQWTQEATARIKLMSSAILSPVTVCFAILSPVTVCFAILSPVTVCFAILSPVTVCFAILSPVTVCFAILSPVTVCFALLLPVTVCFALLLPVTVCFALFNCYLWLCALSCGVWLYVIKGMLALTVRSDCFPSFAIKSKLSMCMHAHMHTHTLTCMHTHMYKHTHAHTHKHMYMHISMHAHTYTYMGAGIAQWLEHRTRDWKVAGSNPCWNGGRIFFSRVDFLCWLLFRYPFHPRVTTVARKKSQSFCQKCRWQVTAKNAYTLRMWILLNRASALVTTCP